MTTTNTTEEITFNQIKNKRIQPYTDKATIEAEINAKHKRLEKEIFGE